MASVVKIDDQASMAPLPLQGEFYGEEGPFAFLFLGEEAPVKKTSSVTIINIYGLDSASGSCILTYKVDYEDGSMCIARTEASYERGGTSYKCVFTDIFGVERQGSKLAGAA